MTPQQVDCIREIIPTTFSDGSCILVVRMGGSLQCRYGYANAMPAAERQSEEYGRDYETALQVAGPLRYA